MRLFTGIAIDPAVVERVRSLVDVLRTKANLNWSPPENYHITTRFLGHCADDQLGPIVDALQRVPRPGPFELVIEGLGFFPNARSPRVFWAGISVPEALRRLASDTDLALTALGFEPETRAYSPHLTLARVKPGQNAAPIAQDVTGEEKTRFGAFTVREFLLYRSCPGCGGSVYEKLREFLLE